MNIRINGMTESVERAENIAELVSRKGLHPERVVIEHNRRIVPAGEWQSVRLAENDTVEIVSFVGGG